MFLKIAILIFLSTIFCTLYIHFNLKRIGNKSKLINYIRKIVICTNISLIITTLASFAMLMATDYREGVILVIILLIAIITPQLLYSFLSIITDLTEIISKKRATTVRVAIGTISTALLLYLSIWLTLPSNNYKIEEVNLSFKNMPQSMSGLKVVQISDIHIDNFSKKEYESLWEMTAIVNSLNPDIVALTGDIISSHPEELDNKCQFLKDIKAKYGKYFIYGNHDVGTYNDLTKEEKARDILKLDSILINSGFTILRDSVVTISNGVDSIYLIGVDEYKDKLYKRRFAEVSKKISPSTTSISLSHDPNSWSRAKSIEGITIPDLTLAGHTHAMQVEVKCLGIDWSLSDLFQKYPRGLFKEGEKYLYVNKGIGYHVYRRIGTYPEITLYKISKQN